MKNKLASLYDCITGQPIQLSMKSHRLNQIGSSHGQLVGGNLAILAHLIGTPSDIDTKGKILFIEDVGEHIYQIDRMMIQLKRSGKLSALAGLVVGGFTDIKDTDRPFGKTIEEVIKEAVSAYDYPVAFGFPVSHGHENLSVKIGIEYQLEVSKMGSRLREI
jgi:muramoyltetrapeptide carboxypeptidase